jgi:hypothetical protein
MNAQDITVQANHMLSFLQHRYRVGTLTQEEFDEARRDVERWANKAIAATYHVGMRPAD